jgi:hypothetical protein
MWLPEISAKPEEPVDQTKFYFAAGYNIRDLKSRLHCMPR